MGVPFHCACGYSGEEDEALLGKLSACPRCGELQRVGGEQRTGVRAERPEPKAPTPPAWADRAAPKNPYAPPTASPYAPPRSEWGAAEVGDGPPRDLDHEAHVVAIGAWQQIGGALLVAFGLLAGGMAVLGGASMGRRAGPAFAVAGVMLVFLVGVGGVMFVIGHGLRTLKNWSRWVCGALIGLQLLAQGVNVVQNPQAILGAGISSVWNVAILWALFCERANHLFAPEYQDALRYTPGSPRWTSSPFFWLPFVFCLLGCCLGGLAGGFAGAMSGR
ncbi:MAG: hypothetical protein KDD82_04595 [Planctomycetes bacterium]|nr:hypothetical protein [Planctomycetota bacterium]